MPDLDDVVLLRRSLQGDVEAYGEIVARYERTVFSTAYRILGVREDAEDAAQETFVKAYRSLKQFNLDLPFAPWIRRIAANLSLNILRGRRPQEVLEDEHVARGEAAFHPEKLAIRSENRDRILSGLMALPEPYRVVVVLRHYHDMSYAEMAAALRLPLSTIKSNLFRARRMLAEILVANDA
ncbi:MAG: sigma-70 family RNA polymerase sigma factor [Anaerolineales bacterium]|nr:sigma-70 family RNA polymerase sigma factor [Anaerolineales bacterium]